MMLKKLLFIALTMLAAVIMLASCGSDAPTPATDAPSTPDITNAPVATNAPTTDGPATEAPETNTPQPDTTVPSTNGSAEITDVTTSAPSTESAEVAVPVGYDWSKPVPESAKKDVSWFDNALFIGDSRIGGFQTFAGVYNAEYITFPGMAVDKYFSWKFYMKNGTQLTASEAIKTIDKKYTKVYINLGLNELGWDPYFGPFYNKLCDVIDSVREWNPDADIYLINVFPISKERTKTGPSWETLKNVDEINSRIARAAEEKLVYYIDMDTIFRDAEGYLPAGYSNDGVHLNSAPVGMFRDYLLTHTVED